MEEIELGSGASAVEKIQLGTADGVQENIERLAKLFPQVATEVQGERGETKRAIDFDALRDLLGDVAEGTRERYQFTWPGKAEAKAEARRPITKTMRPQKEKSVNWDTTENLYIEGDNLDALKILKETYAGKVKLIYIDPPYNTGHDFVYDDDYAKTRGEYDVTSGDYDEEGGRLVANTEGNGRFHSDWCSMMYPRLMLARDLLSADGFIAISIGEEEVDNLQKICNEVLGESNFRNIISVRRYDKNINLQFAADGLSTMNVGLEFILVYSKSLGSKMNAVYKESSEERARTGYWKGFWNNADRPTMRYDILGVTPTEGQWKWKRDVAEEAVENYKKYKEQFASRMTIEEYWLATGKNLRFIRRKSDGTGKNLGVEHWVAPTNGILRNSNWSDLLISKPIGMDIKFDSPKNIDVLKVLIDLAGASECSVVLDFFSGSATTAHAVMQLNAEDGGHRKFVMVQLPEETDEKSEAHKAGYSNICEIGEERIRRAGAKIAAEVEESNRQLKIGEDPKPVPDIGFRVLAIDSSNMRNTHATPEQITQEDLFSLADNVKDGRTEMDLLFEVLPKFRIPYSARIEEITLGGKRCFAVNDNQLIACFDIEVGTETIEEIAKREPDYAVMRDASMANDATQANFEELFRTYSPDTVRRVI